MSSDYYGKFHLWREKHKIQEGRRSDGLPKPVPSFRAQKIALDGGSGAYLGLLVAANENFEFFLPTMKFP